VFNLRSISLEALGIAARTVEQPRPFDVDVAEAAFASP
jgi:hypothetical protein